MNLEPGDILLFADKGHWSMVSISQGVTRLNPVIWYKSRRGSIYTNHAAIIFNTIIDKFAKVSRTKMAHAVNSGVDRTEVPTNFRSGPYGGYIVFRLNANYKDYAIAAGQVAEIWTRGGSENMPYAHWHKVMSPGFHNSDFGSGAKTRAQHYVNHKNTIGGPAGFKDGTKKSMFCSMFVIACYQAALGEAMSGFLMALDAKHTSPMKLESYLYSNSHWEFIGTSED